MAIGSFREEAESLAPLETFDPEAFRGDNKVPQTVCNLVLTLALIYNDCKDGMYAHLALTESRPPGPARKTRAWGAITGAQNHAFRGMAGLVHELLRLIRDSDEALAHPFFLSVLQQVHPGARTAWQALVDVAHDATPSDELGKSLLLIRNKVFFHYDPKAIFAGYTEHFLGATRSDDRAYLSRGDRMRATRFYFADAAATGYLKSALGPDPAGALVEKFGDVLDTVNNSLMLIVGSFIQRRGYSFRAETEPR